MHMIQKKLNINAICEKNIEKYSNEIIKRISIISSKKEKEYQSYEIIRGKNIRTKLSSCSLLISVISLCKFFLSLISLC